MSEFDLKGEVSIQTVPVSIATVRLGVDGAPDRVVDRWPTGVHVQVLRIGGPLSWSRIRLNTHLVVSWAYVHE